MRTYDPPAAGPLAAQPLSSTARLAALHSRRAMLYETLDLLLTAIDEQTALPPLRERLEPSPLDGAYRSAGILREVVSAFDAATLAGCRQRLTADGILGEGEATLAHAAHCWAEVGAEPRRAAEEPGVLARLAHGTAAALRRGDLIEASVLAESQLQLLRDHCACCLTALAHRLVDSGSLPYTNVGLALREIVEDDLDLLEPPHV